MLRRGGQRNLNPAGRGRTRSTARQLRLRGARWLVIAELRFDERDSTILRAAPVDEAWLRATFPQRFVAETQLAWNADTRAVEAAAVERFDAIQLARSTRAVPRDADTARRFPRRRLLTAFVSVCRAIDYAHARGVVHRDLKPSNIMLGEFGEVHVLDWGIAKVRSSAEIEPAGAAPEELSLGDTVEAATPAHAGTGPTAHGALLGTPGFMSPEQARGEIDRVDARSDVFALGAVLFEILTLSPMIRGVSAMGRVQATARLELDRSPAARAPAGEVPPELDVACVLATMPDPKDRTRSAGELAEAVDRYLDGDRDVALRRSLDSKKVTAADFDAAFADTRATVTAEMERDYEKIAGEIKQKAASIQPIGFFAPGMLKPTNAVKHDGEKS